MVAVPFVDCLIAGPPCVNKSPLSCNASQFKSCIADEEGATGLGFKYIFDYTRANQPTFVVLENLRQLVNAADDQEPEIHVVINKFTDLGYWCSFVETEARDYGSVAARDRVYIVASKIGDISCGDFFKKVVLATTTVPGDPGAAFLPEMELQETEEQL
eukprot:9147490-Lingulodinium_polyedra.AAC.1